MRCGVKNRVWKYCRQDGYGGDDCGIRTQELWINRYISTHRLISVGESKVFENGTTTNRPSLQELIQKAQEQTYDILLVSALDRLGRDFWSTMEYTKKLLRMGIRIISVNDNVEITERDFDEMDNFVKSICE